MAPQLARSLRRRPVSSAARVRAHVLGELGLPSGLMVIDGKASEKQARRSRPVSGLANEIVAFSELPRLSWGFAELDKYAPLISGNLVVVIGATGRGKTSFVLQIGCHHAETLGPVLFVSAELVGAIAGARIVSNKRRTVWAHVLAGKEDEQAIREALDVPNMRIIDEIGPDIIQVIDAELAAFSEEFNNKPALVIVDYVQLLPGSGEIRHRVTDNVVALRKLAAKYGACVMIISKAGRSAAKELRGGAAVGTDATEAGAETNAIEHEAIGLVALGAMKPVDANDPDGPSIVDVSIAKARFGVADKVVPLRFDGASGRFESHGPAVRASDRRAEAKAKSASVKIETLARSILQLVAGRESPMSKAEITDATTGNNSDIAAAIAKLVADGSLVYVKGNKKGGHWPLWTPKRAMKAGVEVIPEAVLDHG